MKYFSGAAMLPKRVGLPSMQRIGAPQVLQRRVGRTLLGHGLRGAASLPALTAGTVRSVALAPATDSMPRQAWRASSAVLP